MLADGLVHRHRQRTGVADARRAAVANQIEAEFVEIGLQTGFVEVIAHHSRTGSERGLHQRIDAQAALDGLFGQQPRRQHHRGIAGVGATGDRRDQHAAVPNLAFKNRGWRIHGVRRRPVVGHFHFGGRIGVVLLGRLARHRFLAAAAGRPSALGGHHETLVQFFARFAKAVLRDRLGQRRQKFLFQVRQFNSVLRALRPGHAGHDGGQVQFQVGRIINLSFLRQAEETLGAIITLVNSAVLVAASGSAQVAHALFVNRKETHRRAIFWGHIRDRRAVHDRQGGCARPVKLDEFAYHLRLTQHLRDGQGEVRRGDAFP